MSVRIRFTRLLLGVSWSLSCLLAAVGVLAQEFTGSEPVVFNPDTSWCWFQDNRAILDDDRLLLSGVSSRGDVTVAVYDSRTGESAVHVLHSRLEADDHNAAALLILPDGRYLVVYTKHGSDSFTRWRISKHPGDASRWEPERRFDNQAGATYSNVYRMASEGENGRIYNFTRTLDRDPNFLVSDDHGASWRYGGRLLDSGDRLARPYVRYAGNGVDTIHFITTEDHPNRFNTGIYHGMIRGKKAYRSDGTAVNEDIFRVGAPRPSAFTRVFEGDPENVAWTSDIELDREGRPYVVFSVMKDALPRESGKRGFDHRYHYAKWDGTCWREREIARAGSRLYPREPEYTGLIALHPRRPELVFLSADVHPASGEPLLVDGKRRYEIFQGATPDGGETWSWTAVTTDSAQDNLRPIVVAQKDIWVLAWLRGEYRTYTDYSQEAVGFVFREVR